MCYDGELCIFHKKILNETILNQTTNEKYNIEINAADTIKSTWKSHVKAKIQEKMESEIREACSQMKKTRSVKNDKYIKKEYLGCMELQTVKKVIKARLHMSKLPGNYKAGGEGKCLLCNIAKGSTEHYFQCPGASQLARVWEVQERDLKSQDIDKMKAVANFLEKVECMLEPMSV